MTDQRTPDDRLRELALAATDKQVHPTHWRTWVELVMGSSPSREFVAAASPSVVLALLDRLRVAPLDVERLAIALHSRDIGCEWHHDGDRNAMLETHREQVRALEPDIRSALSEPVSREPEAGS